MQTPSLSDQDFEPLTLRREWEMWSELPESPDLLTLAKAEPFSKTYSELQKHGIISLQDLLLESFACVCEKIGMDAAEEVLSAITAYAIDIGTSPDIAVWNDPNRPLARTSVLTARLKHIPASALHLDDAAARAVHRIQASTISDVLTALDPLHVELALDPHGFCGIWTKLQALGLLTEDWEDAGERLSAEASSRTSLDHVARAWREAVTPALWQVASLRFGLEPRPDMPTLEEAPRPQSWSMPTLDEVAARYPATREGIRQMEVRFIERLTRRQDDYFLAIQNMLAMITRQEGGVITLRRAAEELAEWINPGDVAPEGICRLILNNSPSFVRIRKNVVYALANQPHGLYHDVISVAHGYDATKAQAGPLSALAEWATARLASLLFSECSNPPTTEFVLACLKADGSFDAQPDGPEERRANALTNALVTTIRELGSPRHFAEIAASFNASGLHRTPVTAHYIHRHLVHHRDLFVRVSRGTYGLAEWGMEDQGRGGREGKPVAELIAEYLEARGVPATKEDITTFVLGQKDCRSSSVIQRLLYDGQFHRFGKNKFGLAKWIF